MEKTLKVYFIAYIFVGILCLTSSIITIKEGWYWQSSVWILCTILSILVVVVSANGIKQLNKED